MPRRFSTPEILLNGLLVFVPVALVLEHLVHFRSEQTHAVAVFATSALGVIPLAGMMGMPRSGSLSAWARG